MPVIRRCEAFGSKMIPPNEAGYYQHSRSLAWENGEDGSLYEPDPLGARMLSFNTRWARFGVNYPALSLDHFQAAKAIGSHSR
jgi:hypothetical protein